MTDVTSYNLVGSALKALRPMIGENVCQSNSDPHNSDRRVTPTQTVIGPIVRDHAPWLQRVSQVLTRAGMKCIKEKNLPFL